MAGRRARLILRLCPKATERAPLPETTGVSEPTSGAAPSWFRTRTPSSRICLPAPLEGRAVTVVALFLSGRGSPEWARRDTRTPRRRDRHDAGHLHDLWDRHEA